MATTKLSVSTMYSGQGMCNVIEAFDGATVTRLMLVDFGAEKDSATARMYTLESLIEKIEAHGVIDVLLVSHSDKDHWNLMSELLDALDDDIEINMAVFGAGNWVNAALRFRQKVSGRLASDDSLVVFHSAVSDIVDGGANINYWNIGWPGVTFHILAASVGQWDDEEPDDDDDGTAMQIEEPNTASIVLVCEFARKYSILTGDATGETLRYINEKMGTYGFGPGCFMVTAPHHGAIATLDYTLEDLTTFIGKCRPQCSLASAQLRSGFNHPNVCVMATMAAFGGKNAYTPSPHQVVLNFPATDLCDDDAIYQDLDSEPAAVARAGYYWFELETEFNIFTTLLTGATATNWYFDTLANGTTSITQGALTLDFVAGRIYRTVQPVTRRRDPPEQTEFYVGRPPFPPPPARRFVPPSGWPDDAPVTGRGGPGRFPTRPGEPSDVA